MSGSLFVNLVIFHNSINFIFLRVLGNSGMVVNSGLLLIDNSSNPAGNDGIVFSFKIPPVMLMNSTFDGNDEISTLGQYEISIDSTAVCTAY